MSRPLPSRLSTSPRRLGWVPSQAGMSPWDCLACSALRLVSCKARRLLGRQATGSPLQLLCGSGGGGIVRRQRLGEG